MPACLRTTLWPPSQPTSQRAVTVSVSPSLTSTADTPSSVCLNRSSVVPNSTEPPRSASRSRSASSVRHSGVIRLVVYGMSGRFFSVLGLGAAPRQLAVGSDSDHRHRQPAVGDLAIDEAEIAEHLQGAGLDALAARAGLRAGGSLDQPEGDAAAGELNGQGQTGRQAPAISTVSPSVAVVSVSVVLGTVSAPI